jgi:hypothetical protein
VLIVGFRRISLTSPKVTTPPDRFPASFFPGGAACCGYCFR